MLLEHNKQPINLRAGSVFLDGIKVMDAVTCTINFTPDVWSGRQLGEQTESRRWMGYSITGSITRRRNTPWLKELIQRYIQSQRTPEFTIQGLQHDPNSDYGARHGTDLTTCVGVVLTGDLPRTRLDANGQHLDDVINFGAKAIV